MVVGFADKKFTIRMADTFGTRFRGLMGEEKLPEGEGLLLKGCSAIHCCFMKFPIDVIYLDAQNRVLAVETVKPWHAGMIRRGVKNILEVNRGEAEGIKAGDEMEMDL
ncbi:hypothetical protein SAMN02745687_01845 [Lachnospiraceae bacterium NK3A20]|jgi:uncharacterized membrane protein (UPF0127 family)|nr:hypothetical protein SAMN02745687_01845 [Lachnospiraceae bacterium NK3A20]